MESKVIIKNLILETYKREPVLFVFHIEIFVIQDFYDSHFRIYQFSCHADTVEPAYFTFIIKKICDKKEGNFFNKMRYIAYICF